MRWLRRLWLGSQDPFIFHYWDGTYHRSADPLVITQRIEEKLGEDWLYKLQELRRPVAFGAMGDAETAVQESKVELSKQLLAAVDYAFELEEYTHPPGERARGLSQARRLGVMQAFALFTAALVANNRPFAGARSRASPSAGNSPTPSGSASTSTSVA